jgi:hypothetical protein
LPWSETEMWPKPGSFRNHTRSQLAFNGLLIPLRWKIDIDANFYKQLGCL